MSARVERSPERLVFFSDAVVAIAVTLLILPLAEAVPEAVARHTDSVDLIAENQGKIYGFLLSFAVILRLWTVHHRVFEQIKAYNRPLMLVNFCWLLTIVVLPFPTEMVSGYGDDRFTRGLYIGTILAAGLCQFAIVLIARSGTGIAREGAGDLGHLFVGGLISSAALGLAFLLVALAPGVSYYPLLLLLLNGPIERLRERRRAVADRT